jgi:nucleotide-binding universal stress UspA family protein
MYRHILIPTDGSVLATKAVEHGMELAKEINAKVTVLTVTTSFHVFTVNPLMIEDTAPSYRDRVEAQVKEVFAAAAQVAQRVGLSCDTARTEHEHPYQAIIDTATARACDLIIMYSHGRRGVSALVLGSETLKVLTHCKIPVLVHR